MKRLFDIGAAFVGLLILSPLILAAAIAVKLSSPGPICFKQKRMGKAFQPFWIIKFRTMIEGAAQKGNAITVGEDPRITRVGRVLRKSKIDELPQLFNILKGEMTFVGPRPELPHFVALYRDEYEDILKVKPGLTDLASLKYRDEAALLGKAGNPDEEYVKRVLPDKICLAKDYIRHSSFFFDLRLIFKTIFKLFDFRTSS
jgi:lipopolysaccharide/colanic/teichoic acid biosynthesis glycosyltransferase